MKLCLLPATHLLLCHRLLPVHDLGVGAPSIIDLFSKICFLILSLHVKFTVGFVLPFITIGAFSSYPLKRYGVGTSGWVWTFLMKVKEQSKKFGLKLNIQKTKIMAAGPITSWQIDGETIETERDFILGGSKITADCDCSHEIKWCFLLGRKVMTNLDRILKSRDITLLTKVRLVKAMVFPVVMYGCESWTIKKAEHRRIDAFELWWWRLLRVPWIARRSNQSIRKEIIPEYSLEGLVLKVKLQYFGHLIRTDSFEKTLMLGKIEGGKRRGWQRMRWLGGITDLMDMSLSKLWEWTEKPGVLQSMGSQRVIHDWVAVLKGHV